MMSSHKGTTVQRGQEIGTGSASVRTSGGSDRRDRGGLVVFDTMGPARPAHHEFALEQDVAGGEIRICDAFQHGANRGFSDLAARLVESGQRDAEQPGVLDVIHADDA